MKKLIAILILMTTPLLAQTPAMRARIDATLAAFNGTPEQFEKYAQEAYAPPLLNRATPEQRARFLTRLRGDFGKIEMTTLRRLSPTRVAIGIKGSTGAVGTIEIEHETAEPHKLTDQRIMIGEGDGDEPQAPPVPINASMSASELAQQLDKYLTNLVAEDRFAGTVLIARDGKPVVEKSYGLANRADRVPNTNATRYNIGSINKHFTRIAIGQLMTAGKLSTSDTIGKHIPDYPNENARKATLKQLLDMQGGLADFFGPDFEAAPKHRFRTNRDYYAFVAPKPLLFEPGTNRRYCNSCYIVLGEIVERLSGMSYEKYVQENVFKRAGMDTAAFIATDDIAPNVAIGYTRGGAGGSGPLRSNVVTRGAGGSAAGSAYATTRDLLTLDEALRNGRMLDPKGTAWFYSLDAPPSGRVSGESAYAGGSGGVNGAVNSGPVWTVVVLGNLDPPTAENLAGAIYRALK